LVSSGCSAYRYDESYPFLQGSYLQRSLVKRSQKNAFTEEQAEIKFQSWIAAKEEKIAGKQKAVELEARDVKKERLAAEKEVNETRAAKYAEERAAEMKKKEDELKAAAKEAADLIAEQEAKAAGIDTEAAEKAAEQAEEAAEKAAE